MKRELTDEELRCRAAALAATHQRSLDNGWIAPQVRLRRLRASRAGCVKPMRIGGSLTHSIGGGGYHTPETPPDMRAAKHRQSM